MAKRFAQDFRVRTYQEHRAREWHAHKRAEMIATEEELGRASADQIIDDLPNPEQQSRLRQMYPTMFLEGEET